MNKVKKIETNKFPKCPKCSFTLRKWFVRREFDSWECSNQDCEYKTVNLLSEAKK